MFVWVWPIILWTEKNTFGGGFFCYKGPNMKNQFFEKKYLVKFFENFFCSSDAEFFSDSKMVLLFEFRPKFSDLRRITVFPFENGKFPLFRSECPWNTLRGKYWSKMVPMIFTGHIMKVYGEIGPQNFVKFESVWFYKYSPTSQKIPILPLKIFSHYTIFSGEVY